MKIEADSANRIQIDEIFDAVCLRSRQLHEDAKLLLGAGSIETAISLSVLSVEESGKACLLKWLLNGKISDADYRKFARDHVKKQLVFPAYLLARTAIDSIQEDWDKLRSGEVKYLIVEDLKKKAQAADHSGASWVSLQVEMGFYDLMKQSGFYVDTADNSILQGEVLTFPESTAIKAIQEAGRAIQMVDEPDEVQAAILAVYLGDSRFPNSNSRRDALAKFIEILKQFGDVREAEKPESK